jgi:hypothetical protein
MPLGVEVFVNDALNTLIIPINEYKLISRQIFSFMDAPAILNPAVKVQLLRKEAQYAGQLLVTVRREAFFDDVAAFVDRTERGQFHRLLSVKFANESAQDEGGVSREFFTLLAQRLFERGVCFVKVNKNSFHWFKVALAIDRTRARELRIAGLLLRLTLTNGAQLPVRFPRALYKRLKGERLTLADYAELNPEAAEGLEMTRRSFVSGEVDSEDFG